MSNEANDFLNREDVQRALDELFDECAARYEAPGEAPLPDAGAFLRERDLEPPTGTTLQLSREVRQEEAEALNPPAPQVIIDPGTGKWCYRRCEWRGGERVCHMVCA